MISSDKILTMADPAPSIVEKYMDLVDKNEILYKRPNGWRQFLSSWI
ncbi:MAG: hypothetical protein CM15mL5_0830 [uncultured marine virus]|nr:MAG: hypothetical protein CM15mL5_0830 [uncultured marine virus]